MAKFNKTMQEGEKSADFGKQTQCTSHVSSVSYCRAEHPGHLMSIRRTAWIAFTFAAFICKYLYSTALHLKDNCKHDLKFIHLDSWELLVDNYSGWQHSFQKRVKRSEVKRYQQLKNKTQCNKAEPINSDLCFMLQIYLRYNNFLPILHDVS